MCLGSAKGEQEHGAEIMHHFFNIKVCYVSIKGSWDLCGASEAS